MQSTIFVSYSRQDSEFVLRLVNDLKSRGAEVWIDQVDIPPSQPWDSAIARALKESQQYLVVLSPASVTSRYVMDELFYALDMGKKVFPVLYRDCEIPLRLRRIQYVDFRGEYEPAFPRLLAGLAGGYRLPHEVEDREVPNFRALAETHYRHAKALRAIEGWMQAHSEYKYLNPMTLAADLRSVDANDLAASLMVLVREGLFRRSFQVMAPGGRLAPEKFADIRDIPPSLKDASGRSFDTIDADIVPMFSKAGVVADER